MSTCEDKCGETSYMELGNLLGNSSEFGPTVLMKVSKSIHDSRNYSYTVEIDSGCVPEHTIFSSGLSVKEAVENAKIDLEKTIEFYNSLIAPARRLLKFLNENHLRDYGEFYR
jgi:hypothetical protein